MRPPAFFHFEILTSLIAAITFIVYVGNDGPVRLYINLTCILAFLTFWIAIFHLFSIFILTHSQRGLSIRRSKFMDKLDSIITTFEVPYFILMTVLWFTCSIFGMIQTPFHNTISCQLENNTAITACKSSITLTTFCLLTSIIFGYHIKIANQNTGLDYREQLLRQRLKESELTTFRPGPRPRTRADDLRRGMTIPVRPARAVQVARPTSTNDSIIQEPWRPL